MQGDLAVVVVVVPVAGKVESVGLVVVVVVQNLVLVPEEVAGSYGDWQD